MTDPTPDSRETLDPALIERCARAAWKTRQELYPPAAPWSDLAEETREQARVEAAAVLAEAGTELERLRRIEAAVRDLFEVMPMGARNYLAMYHGAVNRAWLALDQTLTPAPHPRPIAHMVPITEDMLRESEPAPGVVERSVLELGVPVEPARCDCGGAVPTFGGHHDWCPSLAPAVQPLADPPPEHRCSPPGEHTVLPPVGAQWKCYECGKDWRYLGGHWVSANRQPPPEPPVSPGHRRGDGDRPAFVCGPFPDAPGSTCPDHNVVACPICLADRDVWDAIDEVLTAQDFESPDAPYQPVVLEFASHARVLAHTLRRFFDGLPAQSSDEVQAPTRPDGDAALELLREYAEATIALLCSVPVMAHDDLPAFAALRSVQARARALLSGLPTDSKEDDR